MTMSYPQLAAAVERVRQNRHHADHHRKCEACAAQQEALTAYAEELLPDILGGQWAATHRYGWPPFYGNRGTSAGGSIYDHETVFRQRGARGPSSHSRITHTTTTTVH